jgi:hypothetical protein
VKYPHGTEVEIIGGDFKGYRGKIEGFEGWAGLYLIKLPEFSGVAACKEHQIRPVQPDSEPQPEPEVRVVDQIPIPTFPASAEDLQNHLEWMLPRVLGKIGEVGPEQALFGFQQFEGKTPTQILVAMMEKLEESMAMHAQVHILLGRIVIALETPDDQK